MTVKHLTGSPRPLGKGLRNGLTVYFKEEIEAFVFLFLQRSTSSTGSLKRSLRCTPRVGWTFCPTCPRTPRSSKSAPDLSQGRGEMAMVAPLLPSFVRHRLCSRGRSGQPLTGSPHSFSASFVIVRIHKVGSPNDHPTRLGDRKKKTHKDG